VERGVTKKSRKKRLSCNHRGFTFSAKKTEIGDKKKKVEKKGKPVTIGLRPILTAYQNFSPFFYFIAEMAKNRVLVSLDACSLPNQILTCSISFIIPINSCST
jgi:hypothetical protein